MGLGMLHWWGSPCGLRQAPAQGIKRTATAIGERMALLPTVVTHQLAGVKIPAHLLFLRQATVLTSPPTIPTASP